MSGKSMMNKFVIRNIVQRAVHCTYVCVFYLMLLSLLDTAGIGADKMPKEDISAVSDGDEVIGRVPGLRIRAGRSSSNCINQPPPYPPFSWHRMGASANPP